MGSESADLTLDLLTGRPVFSRIVDDMSSTGGNGVLNSFSLPDVSEGGVVVLKRRPAL